MTVCGKSSVWHFHLPGDGDVYNQIPTLIRFRTNATPLIPYPQADMVSGKHHVIVLEATVPRNNSSSQSLAVFHDHTGSLSIVLLFHSSVSKWRAYTSLACELFSFYKQPKSTYSTLFVRRNSFTKVQSKAYPFCLFLSLIDAYSYKHIQR